MTLLEERAVPVRFTSESARGVGPATLEVAGVDLSRHARSVVIRSSVAELATVDIEVLALGGLDVTLPAAVTVHMLPLEEGDMDAETLPDGTIRYRFRRKARDV